MPLPPPPADALISTGKPIVARRRGDARVGLIGRRAPGTTGTPACCHQRRARAIFDPIRSIAAAGGPTNTSPASSQASANAARLRQESVAGMDRVGADVARRVDDRSDRSGSSRAAGAGPMRTATSAARTCSARASASE